MTDRKNYLSLERARQVEHELRLMRAVEAYRTFFPSISAWSFFAGGINMGLKPNHRHGYFQVTPDISALTPNSDTPYAIILLDVSDQPMVLDLPKGAMMGVVNDWYFQETGNVGLTGPDGGAGGKYLIVGPEYDGDLPKEGFYIYHPDTNHCFITIRAIPRPKQIPEALDLLAQIKTYPQDEQYQSEMISLNSKSFVVSPVMREDNLEYWQAIHEIINKDVLLTTFYMEYGRLADVGIERNKPFPNDVDTQELLIEAARIALEQMTVEAFFSTRSDRSVWETTFWEWVGIIPDTGFIANDHMDVYARDRWFYQATLSTEKMFTRVAGAGSLYLLATKDKDGSYLDGSKTYRLHVPASIPASQFWSLTIYDLRYRSEINTDQKNAAIRSLHDNVTTNPDGSIDLYVGAKAPIGHEEQWIKTIPGEGWFAYFRVYGPEEGLFDGTWKLADFEIV